MTKSIEERLAAIESRNQRVENDKAWETSWIRKVSIMTVTYLVVAAYLHFVIHTEPWINALVPVIGFLLSTLTISFIKQQWLQRRSK